MERLNLPPIWASVKVGSKYEVSDSGLVRRGEKLLNPYDDGYGYSKVSINKVGYRVHRLVAICFIENPNNYRCVNHKDGNKKNNRVGNLEWCNHSQNRIHALKIGLINQGHERKDASLSKTQVISIRKEYETGTVSQRELAAKYSVGKSMIQLLLTNKTYKNAL